MQKGLSGLIPSKLHSLMQSTSISFSLRKCCNNKSLEVSAPLIFREATHMKPVLAGFFLLPPELAEIVELNCIGVGGVGGGFAGCVGLQVCGLLGFVENSGAGWSLAEELLVVVVER